MVMAIDKWSGVELTEEERREVDELVVYDPEVVLNPYSGESCRLNGQACAVYDWIRGAEMFGDYRSVEMGLRIFSKNWPEEYMILLD